MTALTFPLAGGNISTIEWDDAWTSLDGISERTMREHWKLYEGYVAKWKALDEAIKGVDLASANQIYSDIRALKVDLSFAIGGVKNHQVYFAGLGADGGRAPKGWLGEQIERQWGSYDNWKADIKATGMGGRGWAFLGYDWDTGLLYNYIGDAQNTFPVWNATLLAALDVYEHAYFLDFGTARADYIDAWLRNLDWSWAESMVETLRIGQNG